jgi:flagellar biogenesis protein FliO
MPRVAAQDSVGQFTAPRRLDDQQWGAGAAYLGPEQPRANEAPQDSIPNAAALANPPAQPPTPTRQMDYQAPTEAEPPAAAPLTPPQNSVPLSPASPQRGGGSRREVSNLLTGAASLAIVVGLFLLVAWAVRRGMPRTSALLPAEAVEVLGRVPLLGKQQLHMIRCGNKMLLVYIAPTGVQTLTEITDPAEVDRLAGLCQAAHPSSAAASFRQVYEQFDESPRDVDYPLQPAAHDGDYLHTSHARSRGSHA